MSKVEEYDDLKKQVAAAQGVRSKLCVVIHHAQKAQARSPCAENAASVSDAQLQLTLINTTLKDLADRSYALNPIERPGVTRASVIRGLMSWEERLHSTIKNPKTQPAEKLFSEQTLKIIHTLIGKPT